MQRELTYELEPAELARRERRTVVVNVRAEEFDVYVGRRMHYRPPFDGRVVVGDLSLPPGFFGNPYTLRGHGQAALELFRAYFLNRIKEPAFAAAVRRLKGLRLGCWCKPRACHGDVIAEWVEANVR